MQCRWGVVIVCAGCFAANSPGGGYDARPSDDGRPLDGVPLPDGVEVSFADSFDGVEVDPARWVPHDAAGCSFEVAGGSLTLQATGAAECFLDSVVTPTVDESGMTFGLTVAPAPPAYLEFGVYNLDDWAAFAATSEQLLPVLGVESNIVSTASATSTPAPYLVRVRSDGAELVWELRTGDRFDEVYRAARPAWADNAHVYALLSPNGAAPATATLAGVNAP